MAFIDKTTRPQLNFHPKAENTESAAGLRLQINGALYRPFYEQHRDY